MTFQTLSIRDVLKEDSLFNELSAEDLAKLAGAVEIDEYKAGQEIFKTGDQANCCFVLVSGDITLFNERNERCSLAGRSFGEEAVSLDCYVTTAIALSDLVLLRIEKSVLNGLKSQSPGFATHASLVLVERFSATKLNVKKAAKKLTVPHFSAKEKVGWLLATVLPLLTYFLAESNGFSSYASIFIAIICAVIVMWAFTIVEEFVPPVVAVVASILTGLAPTNVALSGFASPAFLTLLGVYALSGTIIRSGLSYRVVLILQKALPSSASSNQLVLLVSGYLLSFVTPSGNNRISLLLPVAKDMVSSLRLGPQSGQATALFAATFGGAMLFSPMLAVSKSANITAVSLLPEAIQERFLGFYWLYCALFCAIGITAVHLYSIRRLFPKTDIRVTDKNVLERQLECLGPMRSEEKIAAWAFVIFILFCVTYSIHQIDLSVVSGVLLMALLLFGVYSKVDFRNQTDWPMVFFLLGVDSMMNIMGYLKLDQALAASVQNLYQFVDGRLLIFIAAAGLTTLIIRLALPLGAGMLTAFAILLPVSVQQHVHPWICLFVCAVFSDIWFFPYQSSVYLQLKSTVPQTMYSEREFCKYNLTLNAGRVAVVFASIPWWTYLGLV